MGHPGNESNCAQLSFNRGQAHRRIRPVTDMVPCTDTSKRPPPFLFILSELLSSCAALRGFSYSKSIPGSHMSLPEAALSRLTQTVTSLKMVSSKMDFYFNKL